IIETAECWELALKSENRPSVLVLSRQNLPMLRQAHSDENRTSQGAYVLREPAEHRAVTLIATGSEVEIAVAAAERLAGFGASAPAPDLYRHFDITPEAVAAAALKLII
ncbi:MAG: transketolase, partial [Mesorhizobium sp.]